MPCCCVPFCKSNKAKDKISFHEFPADLELRFAWLRAIRRRGDKPGTYWQPTDRSVVCQKHFATSDFNVNTKIRRLLPNAVPSIFPGYPTNKFPETHQKRKLHTPETLKPRKKICVKEENNDILSSMSTFSETDTVSLQQSDENFKTSAIVCDVNQSNECNSHELNSEIFQPSRHVNNPETKTNSSKLYKRLEALEKENSKLRNVVKFLSNELLVAKSHKKKESLEEKQLKKIMLESAKNKLPAIMLLEQIRSFGKRKINV